MLRGGWGRAPDSYHTGTRCSRRIARSAAARSSANSSNAEEINTRTRWSGVSITPDRSSGDFSPGDAITLGSCDSLCPSLSRGDLADEPHEVLAQGGDSTGQTDAGECYASGLRRAVGPFR